MIQHTATPFTNAGQVIYAGTTVIAVLPDDEYRVKFVGFEYGENIDGNIQQANSAFIVTVCNCHEELVGLANAAREAWEYMKNDPRLLTHERKAAESWYNHATLLLRRSHEQVLYCFKHRQAAGLHDL